MQDMLSNKGFVDKNTFSIQSLDQPLTSTRAYDIKIKTPYKRGFSMKHIATKGFFAGLMALAASFVPALSTESHDRSPLPEDSLVFVRSSALLPISSPETPERVVSKVRVVITAYSSTTWQTDDTPFVTAAGTEVREGIVAANFLPIGTRIKIPDLYGDRVFVVEDRMHPRKNYMVDIWFPDYWDALDFGAKRSYIEVLGS